MKLIKSNLKIVYLEKNNFFLQFLDLKPEEMEEMFEIMDENNDDKIIFLDIFYSKIKI